MSPAFHHHPAPTNEASIAQARWRGAPPPHGPLAADGSRRCRAYFALALLWFGLTVGNAHGQEPDPSGASAAAPTSASQALSAARLQSTALDNGVKIVMHPDHSLPQVAVCATYDAGTRHDPAQKPGTAAVVHRMLREGGRSTQGADYSRKVEARGGQLNHTLTADMARFCTLVPKHELELALWLESGRMTGFAFNQPNFERRVAELGSEYLDSIEGSVYARGLRRLNEIAFQDQSPIAEPPDPGELSEVSLSDAKSFHQRHYHAKNLVLTLSGDFDPFTTIDLAKRHLGSAHAGDPAPGLNKLLVRQTSPRFSVLIDPSAQTAAAYYGWVSEPSAALRLLNTLLADGEASLLYEDLVHKQRQASSLGGWTTQRAGQEIFALRVQTTRNGRLDVIEKHISAILARIAHGSLVSDPVLQAAKRRRLKGILQQISSNLGKAELLGERKVLGLPLALGSEVEHLESVTAEQLRDAARQQLVLARRTSVEVYPKEWHDPNQAAMPKFHVVSAGENLTRIAKMHGTTPDAIAKMNGINQKQPIFPGQKLRVPRGTGKQAQQRATKKRKQKKEAIAYTIKKGDSLSTIAARHQISVAALLRANRIDPKKPLQIGQRLAIPVP